MNCILCSKLHLIKGNCHSTGRREAIAHESQFGFDGGIVLVLM